MTRYRTAMPAIPFIFLHGLERLSVTTIPSPIAWNLTDMKTSEFAYETVGTRITINRGGQGIYMLYLNAGVIHKAGFPEQYEFTVYKNGVAVPGCTAHSVILWATTQHSDVGLIAVISVSVGDYIEIYASVDVGTGELEADATRLILKGLPTKGWDNLRAGKTRTRGEVFY